MCAECGQDRPPGCMACTTTFAVTRIRQPSFTPHSSCANNLRWAVADTALTQQLHAACRSCHAPSTPFARAVLHAYATFLSQWMRQRLISRVNSFGSGVTTMACSSLFPSQSTRVAPTAFPRLNS
eukprot:6214728-Pleurochrysis_carterae.AAC.1